MPWLINASQLDKFRKSQKSLIILDATWHMPQENRNAKQEFCDKHIIDSQFFDIDTFSDPNPDQPHHHMLLRDENRLSELVSALGIRNDYKIIFYDNSKLHSACRALWMFKMFGHNPQLLYVLDGGMAAWDQYGGKTESGEPTITTKPYSVKLCNQYIRTLSQMKENLHHPKEQVIDVRHAVRYTGGKEVRPGVRSGHIPGSICFPYTSLFEKNDFWRPLDKIRRILAGVGVDLDAPIITTCGSGMSAPTLNFALDLIGNANNSVYNGSWTEWGAEKIYQGETDLSERPVLTSLDN